MCSGTRQVRKVTLIPGDGIGPECCASVTGVFLAAGVPIEWERFDDLGQVRRTCSLFVLFVC
jgi:isocitrate/isopropylmalate dehydrogenase